MKPEKKKQQIDDIMQFLFTGIVKGHRERGDFLKKMTENRFENLLLKSEEVVRYEPDDIVISFTALDANSKPIAFWGRLSEGKHLISWNAKINEREYRSSELVFLMDDTQWKKFIEYHTSLLNAVNTIVGNVQDNVTSEDFSFVPRIR